MIECDPDRPVVPVQRVYCAQCGAVLERVWRGQKFSRPSCRARYSAVQRERRLLGLAEDLVTLLKRPRRGPRRGSRRKSPTTDVGGPPKGEIHQEGGPQKTDSNHRPADECLEEPQERTCPGPDRADHEEDQPDDHEQGQQPEQSIPERYHYCWIDQEFIHDEILPFQSRLPAQTPPRRVTGGDPQCGVPDARLTAGQDRRRRTPFSGDLNKNWP